MSRERDDLLRTNVQDILIRVSIHKGNESGENAQIDRQVSKMNLP